jgi:hypothetical protein
MDPLLTAVTLVASRSHMTTLIIDSTYSAKTLMTFSAIVCALFACGDPWEAI